MPFCWHFSSQKNIFSAFISGPCIQSTVQLRPGRITSCWFDGEKERREGRVTPWMLFPLLLQTRLCRSFLFKTVVEELHLQSLTRQPSTWCLLTGQAHIITAGLFIMLIWYGCQDWFQWVGSVRCSCTDKIFLKESDRVLWSCHSH